MSVKPDRTILAVLTGHWLSLVGSGLVTTAAITWLLVLPSQMRGHVSNPYIGILLFIALPIVFIGGLALIPFGVYLSRRKLQKGLVDVAADRPAALRRFVLFLAATTVFNIVIGSQLTYRAVEHMEGVQFCGATCHVMKPQFTAYQNRAHSRVLCVECHVAPGASGWVESKMSGTRQLLAVAFDNYPRPVRPAIESGRLVPSSLTCEQCHFPQSGAASRLRVITSYKNDEKNSASHTVLMMKVNGPNSTGIHGSHMGNGVRIRYAATDAKRETIPWVEYRNGNNVRSYATAEAKPEEIAKLTRYEMQCVDCHNRPAHRFELPERAINRAMTSGDLPRSLPFLKKTGMGLLNAAYGSQDEAGKKIGDGLRAYYRSAYPEVAASRAQDIQAAVATLSAIYARNVFPEFRVTWGTYPDNLGHTDSPGCFRCHDDGHVSADKKTITQDCASCHDMLAVDEESPEVLKTLNLGEKLSQAQR